MAVTVRPGDVLVIRTGGWQAWLVRFAAALRDKPNLSNHVAVAHHTDEAGTLWVIEGRPGGAGWRDARHYLTSSLLLVNDAQPKTDRQRQQICKIAEALIASAYDWAAIAADAAQALGWTLPGWEPGWDPPGQVPAHLVCSSLAAFAYEKAGLPHPPGDRGCTPADWDSWILRQEWKQAAGN